MVLFKDFKERLKSSNMENLKSEYSKNKRLLKSLIKGENLTDSSLNSSVIEEDKPLNNNNISEKLKRNQKIVNGHVVNFKGYKEKVKK